jgi:hypothetical protein
LRVVTGACAIYGNGGGGEAQARGKGALQTLGKKDLFTTENTEDAEKNRVGRKDSFFSIFSAPFAISAVKSVFCAKPGIPTGTPL